MAKAFTRQALFLSAMIAFSAPAHAARSRTPEDDTLEIAKLLHPVPDEEWRSIAGDRLSEQYTIVKGDTLYDISNRLFGDPKYWPKIWALNNATITNPHLIWPENAITFTPGSGSSLPMVAISTAEEVERVKLKPNPKKKSMPYISPGIPYTAGRSQEWRKMPRQEWEHYVEPLPRGEDDAGFDKRSRLTFGKKSIVDLPVIVSEDKIDLKGHVEGAMTERAFLNLGDSVVISPEGDTNLQVGDIYAVVGDPNSITASSSDRSGYSYPVFGKVKITSVRDNVFTGSIISVNLHITRGDGILPLPPSPSLKSPMPGPSKQDALILKDPYLTPGVVSQQRFAVVDRGSEDGVKDGMIFRAFSYEDRYSGKHLLDSDVFPNADFIVAYAWPKFSLVIATRGDEMYDNGVHVTLLTDVSDLTQFSGSRVVPVFEENKSSELNDLEGLDSTPGMSKKEEEELKDLEDAATGKKHEAQPIPGPGKDEPPPPTEPESAAPPPPDESTPAEELRPTPELEIPDAPQADDAPPPPEE